MGHSQIGVVDPSTSVQAQVLTTAPSDTGQAGLAVRVLSQNTGSNPASPTAIFNGKTAVATAGTRVTLTTSQVITSVAITALKTNTGIIYVGNSSVSSANGLQLSAGGSVTVVIANLNTVNLDCSVNGEGVTWIAS